MGEHAAGSELLELQDPEKSGEDLALQGGPAVRDHVFHGVGVHRRHAVAAQDAACEPFGQLERRSRIAILLRTVSGLLQPELQANDVFGVARVEGSLPVAVDHIVRRGHHLADVADHVLIVEHAFKGEKVGHPRPR